MPRQPLQPSSPHPLARMAPVMNLQAFADAIQDNGVKLKHFKSIPCPVGQVDQYDTLRKTHHDHSGCANGYVFDYSGTCTCLFLGSQGNTSIIDTGMFDGSTVMVTFPPTYDDTDTPVIIASQDRIALVESQGFVVGQQRFTANARGEDALQFPIERVEFLIDSDGKRYTQDENFKVRDNAILWQGSNRPVGGAVCSVRYLYLPYWYVGRLVHEIRVAMSADPVTGERSLQRYPYSAMLHRENYGRDEQREMSDTLKHREVPAPSDHESELLA